MQDLGLAPGSVNAGPVVSVCIANYNGMRFIDACLRSVIEQICGFAFEIIVHDDASTDGSSEFIAKNYPCVHLIRSIDNAGFCIGNNRMVAAAQGDYVLLLNNDAVLFPDALITLMAEAQKLGGPAILGLPQYDAETGRLLDRGSLLDPFLNPVPNLDAKRQDVGMIMGACLWLPRTLWDELGGFPEWFESIAEDLYLCSRARLLGYPVRLCKQSGFKHWVGKTFGGGRITQDKKLTTTFRRRALSERNKTFTMILIFPFPLMAPIVIVHLLLLVVEGALLSLFCITPQFLLRIYLPVLPSLWSHRKTLVHKRHEIQCVRKLTTIQILSVFIPFPYKLLMLIKYGLPLVR